jgi:glycosyltransferase involved in cell wall biosynthesis
VVFWFWVAFKKNMNLLIIEPYMTGHRSVYIFKIAKHFTSLGNDVTLYTLSGQVVSSELMKLCDTNQRVILKFIGDNKNHSSFGGLIDLAVGGFKNWLLFKRILKLEQKVAKVDLVFLPYFDYILYITALIGSPFGSVRFSGICMRPSFHYKKMGVIAPNKRLNFFKEFLFKRLLNNKYLKSLYSIDELLCEYIKHEKLTYFPDPSDIDLTYSKEVSREFLGIPANEKVILVYGSLDRRKGIDSLLNAAVQLTSEMRPAVLLVGKQSEAVRHLLQGDAGKQLSENKKLYIVDRFVDAKEEGLAFAASDTVWLVYSGHYAMSGVLVKAVQAGLPLIATSNGLIGYYTAKYKLGIVFDGKNQSLLSAINLGCQESKPFLNHTWGKALSVIRA